MGVIQRRSPVPKLTALLALITSAAIQPLSAQKLQPSFSSLRYTPAPDSGASPAINLEPRESEESPTYWAEGALIGGIPFALLGAALAGWSCGRDDGVDNGPCWDNELLGLVIGFGTGASLGALIGGQFKKGDRDSKAPEQDAQPVPE